MITLAALVLAQAAPSIFGDATASKEAVAVFRDACTRGALRLTPDRGRVLKDHQVTDFADVLDWGRATTRRTVIRFNRPRGTFLIFADYKDAQPKGIARECIVVSRVLSLNDALGALIETAPDLEPKQTWIPNMHLPEWIIDAPKRGFRSRARVRSDRSVFLEVSTYASALKASDRAKKQ